MSRLISIPYNCTDSELVGRVQDLLVEAFGDYRSYFALVRDLLADEGHTFLRGTDPVTPVAHIQVVDYIRRVEGKDYSIGYLYAVCTAEEYRKRGVMRTMLPELLEEMKGQGYHAAILVPASKSLFGYYEALGFIQEKGPISLADTEPFGVQCDVVGDVILPDLRARAYFAAEKSLSEESAEEAPLGWMSCSLLEDMPPFSSETILHSPLL